MGWGRGEMDLDDKMKDILATLPMDVLPSSQEYGEIGNINTLQGYNILEIGKDHGAEAERVEGDSQEEKKGELGEKKKGKWGPVVAERRSNRIRNNGRSFLEKAQENKKREDLEGNYNKGKAKKPCRNRSAKYRIHVASSVGISLGKSDREVEGNVKICSELASRNSEENVNTTVGDVGMVRIEHEGVGDDSGGNDKARGDKIEIESKGRIDTRSVAGSSKIQQPKRGKHPRKK
jgi:hypothetical protein